MTIRRMKHVMMASVGVALFYSVMGVTNVTAQAAAVPSDTHAEVGVTVFVYGRTPPTVTCARLRACVFELAPNEVIADKVLAGDTERWLFDVTTSGMNGGTQLLSMKPTDCDLTTNLIVPTDRRVYDLTLRSLPCPDGTHGLHEGDPNVPYTRVFRFAPADTETTPGTSSAHPLTVQTPAPSTTSTSGSHVAPLPLNFAYRWSADGTVPWKPDLVFDDGMHAYIKLPRTGGAAVAPVLFALDEDGVTSVVNYTTANGFYVTDRLAHRFVLAASADGKRDRVVIENRRWR